MNEGMALTIYNGPVFVDKIVIGLKKKCMQKKDSE
jgi:hypothetical protein